MNWRKNMVLVVGGGIAALLIIAALVMLFRFQAGHREVSGQLDSALSRLQQLNNRKPFPSRENIALVEKNLQVEQASALELQAALQRGQLTPDAIEPAEFAPLLERVHKRMVKRADEAGVALPDAFTFGFGRYAAGELPAPTAIPRLVIQLKAVDAVCGLLFQSRIGELLSIEREVFESGEVTPAEELSDLRLRRRQAATTTAPVVSRVPPAQTNDLYGVERITVSFLARETAAWDALNALARSPLFIVVADISLENTLAAGGLLGKKQPPAAIGGEQAVAAGVARYPTHDERVVAGREPVRVNLVLDIYQFSNQIAEEAAP